MPHIFPALDTALSCLAQAVDSKGYSPTNIRDAYFQVLKALCDSSTGEELLGEYAEPIKGLSEPQSVFAEVWCRGTAHLEHVANVLSDALEREDPTFRPLLEQAPWRLRLALPKPWRLCSPPPPGHPEEKSPRASTPTEWLGAATGLSLALVVDALPRLRSWLDALLDLQVVLPSEPEVPSAEEPELPPSSPPEDPGQRKAWEQQQAAHFVWRDKRRLRELWEGARDRKKAIDALWGSLPSEARGDLDALRSEIENVLCKARNHHAAGCACLLDLHQNGRKSATYALLGSHEMGSGVAKSVRDAAVFLGKELERRLAAEPEYDLENSGKVGVSFLDAARILTDDDLGLARDIKNRWSRLHNPSRPPRIGYDPTYKTRQLYAPSALCDWIEKIEGPRTCRNHGLKQRLHAKARPPRE